MIKNNLDINTLDSYDNTELIKASKRCYKKVVELILNNNADINIQGNHFYTALMLASKNGYREIVELLIKNGANINEEDKYCFTALMFSTNNTGQILIKYGADTNIRSKYAHAYNSTKQIKSNKNIKFKELTQPFSFKLEINKPNFSYVYLKNNQNSF